MLLRLFEVQRYHGSIGDNERTGPAVSHPPNSIRYMRGLTRSCLSYYWAKCNNRWFSFVVIGLLKAMGCCWIIKPSQNLIENILVDVGERSRKSTLCVGAIFADRRHSEILPASGAINVLDPQFWDSQKLGLLSQKQVLIDPLFVCEVVQLLTCRSSR